MLLAFVWLTIGTSFLSVEQQKQLNNQTSSKTEADDAEKGTPFENAKEEKTETNPNTFSEEYLREDSEHFSYTDNPLKHNKCHFEKIFPVIYSESVSQPPETVFC